jgi:hypothetical protein
MGRGYGEKFPNENLRPLVRFLRSNAGRPWNDVHAEIAARLSCRSAVQKHVLDHLRDFVREDVVVDGDTVLALAWRGGQPLFSAGTRFYFYVCPSTGLLRVAPPRPRKRARGETSDERVVLSEERELRRVAGIWYEVALLPIPPGGTARCFDVLEHALAEGGCGSSSRSPLWATGRYASRKRQLDTRQLARHGLVNAPA